MMQPARSYHLPASACELPEKVDVWIVALTLLSKRHAGPLGFKSLKLELIIFSA